MIKMFQIFFYDEEQDGYFCMADFSEIDSARKFRDDVLASSARFEKLVITRLESDCLVTIE